MADVKLAPFDWDKLQKSALFVVPRLVEVGASIARGDFSTASHDVAKKHSGSGWTLASSAVTALYDLRPLGHRKCRSAVETFNLIAEREGLTERLVEEDIVSCVFFAPKLKVLMAGAGMTSADFTTTEGALPRDATIVEFMCDHARVPLPVGIRIARSLAQRVPDLQLKDFLYFQHDGAPKVTVRANGRARPFDMEDLEPAASAYDGWTDWSSKSKLPAGIP